MQESWVWSLGGEDPLEKEMATHSSILAWEISWPEEPDGLQFMGSQRVWQDLATKTTKFFWKVFVEKTIFLSLNYPDTSGLCPSIRMLYLTVFSTFALEYWNEAILSLPILLVLFKNYLGNCICLTFYINRRVLISTWRSAAAAAAKSLQLCPTLCDPIDSSPPGSPVPGL